MTYITPSSDTPTMGLQSLLSHAEVFELIATSILLSGDRYIVTLSGALPSDQAEHLGLQEI
jgi:hypothetical protein